MEKIADEQLKRELAFDQYGRYAITRDVINANRKNGEKFRVLDVGGRGNIMRRFLPEDDVFYLDPYVDTNDDNYIEGDGCEMPLENESFDWVVSADVFEHIPEGKRKDFLEENLRVAKLGVLLMAPFYTKEVKQAEINANESYKIISKGNDHIWLKEHIKNELPDIADFENILKEKEVSFQKIYNNRLFLWQTLIGISFLVSENFDDDIKKEFEKFNYFYNTEAFPFDNQDPSYRRIYFIKKDAKLNNIEIKRKPISDSLLLDIMKRAMDLVGKIDIGNKKIIQQKDAEISRKKDELKKKADSCKFEIEDAIIGLTQKLDKKEKKIIEKDQSIQQKNSEMQQKESEVQQKDQTIRKKESEIQQKDQSIRQKDSEIKMIKSSKFWILRNRYIKLKHFRSKHFVQLFSKAAKILLEGKFEKFSWATRKYLIHGWDYFKPKSQSEKSKKDCEKTDYEKWIEKNENFDKGKIREEIKNFKYKPKISIITPVYNVDPKWLDKCIESVQNQFYENWELCLHDDASTKKETIDCLKKWEKKGDRRIKISFGKNNQHISGASNEALKLAAGEFVALLDNDDELSPDALFENVKVLNRNPGADFIYSDEDKLEIDGRRVEPFFKPDFSPDLLLSMNYITHFSVFKKSIIEEMGGFRVGYEGSQDYDLILRFIEKTKKENIFHIPRVLYHWRKIPGSTSGEPDNKNYAYRAAKKALADYLERNDIKGEISDGAFVGAYRVKRKILGNPKISIMIPFKDQAKVTKVCVESVLKKTDYDNFEIILVNNQSEKKETFDYIDTLKNNPTIRVLNFDKPFNFSAINNYAVKKADGEYVLFLNNDMEVISEEWLSSMLEHAQRKEVGAVGAKLLYPNDTIQHAGVVMGLGVASHAFKNIPKENKGCFGLLVVVRNYCCVTAACLMMKKRLFEEIGGFDEKNLAVAFNDVDLCLRLVEKGYYNVWTPFAELYHHESLSRGDDCEENLKLKNPAKYERVQKENEYMREKWKKYIEKDPFYNPNLTRAKEDFSIDV